MRALLAILAFSFSFSAHSADRFYGEIHGAVGGIQHSELSFRPIEAHFSVGGYLWDHIGLDLNFAGPLEVGEDDDFTVQLESLTTLSLRFDSPPMDGLSAFMLFGVSRFSVSQRGVNSQGAARTVRENFQAGTFSIGLRQQLGATPLSLVGLYRLHYVDQPINIDSWALGLRAAWR